MPWSTRWSSQLAHLTSDELRDAGRVASILGLPESFNDTESGIEPRGNRLLYRLPRFSDIIIERIVDRFVNLQQIMRASLGELEQVEGVGRRGPIRSRTVSPAWPRPASSSATSRRRSGRSGSAVRGAAGPRPGSVGRAAATVYTCVLLLHGPDVAQPARDQHAMPGGTVFDIGDKVVYPHHGAAVVERRETKEAFGKKQEYLVLRLAYGDLTLMVPADNTDGVGLREVINDEEVEEVFAVLRKKEARMPTNWSRRYKNHSEKLRSGDIYQVAEVVRNLSIRDKDKGLSAGEKRMLSRARQILVSELTFALGSRRGDRRGSAQRGASLSRSGSVWAIVVAGGSGRRFGGPKQFSALAGRPVAAWSVAAARTVADGVVLVVPAEDAAAGRAGRPRATAPPHALGADRVVAGGATRAASVRAGLVAVPDDAAIIVVHDARPAPGHRGAVRRGRRRRSAPRGWTAPSRCFRSLTP